MRSLLLATSFGAAQSLAVTSKSKKPAVQALMESATTMLKNGATPEVVDFAQTTLDEVTGVVLPAIIAESENDQTFIYSLHDRFAVIHTELEQGNQLIKNLNLEEHRFATEHWDCRQVEHVMCYGDGCLGSNEKNCVAQSTSIPIAECQALHDQNHHDDRVGEDGRWSEHRGEKDLSTMSTYVEGKRKCEMELYDMWESWVTAEEELRGFHNHIEGAFCPPEANGTTKTFRTSAAEWMHDYMIHKAVVDQKLIDYDSKALCCEVAHGALEEMSSRCNLHQHDLEEKACEHAAKIHEVLNTYYRDYSQAASAYRCASEEVRQLESDRKKEFVTLEVVRCLLDRIEKQNGVPCDEETGTVTEAVALCEERHAADVCGPCFNPQFPHQMAPGVEPGTNNHFCYATAEMAAASPGRSGFATDQAYCESIQSQQEAEGGQTVSGTNRIGGWCTLVHDDGCGGCCDGLQMPDGSPIVIRVDDAGCDLYDFDVTKLCIDYRAVPEPPAFCEDRDHVEGLCRPEPIPTPCVDNHNFRWEHYDDLFPVPEGTFTSTNPGCNAQAPCTACEQPATPSLSDHQIDTCPGYTVDGCSGGSEDHPLTFIRSVNGLADVRCCGGVLDVTCMSQDFTEVVVNGVTLTPVDFTTPGSNGGTHTQCYFDKTYQEALEICHSANMRICTVAEMNSDECCGTGCWHNHHAIWVDAQGDTPGQAVRYHTEEQHVTHREAQAANQEWRNQLQED